jgi:hypothetical protein
LPGEKSFSNLFDGDPMRLPRGPRNKAFTAVARQAMMTGGDFETFKAEGASVDIEQRCNRLKNIYEIYEAFTAPVDRACRKHCAACCTCNVTVTTLEGWLIHDQLDSNHGGTGAGSRNFLENPPSRRFHPMVTVNRLVEMCRQGEQPPEEDNDPAAGRCPLVQDDVCPIYPVRPFGCRAMLSIRNCARSGEAHMPPLVLSANHVVMQYIEALDRPGASGNMIDILLFLSDAENRRAYRQGQGQAWPQPLKPNQAFSVLMIPPEHRRAIQPLLQALKGVLDFS